jgi:hypothetical protein
MNERIKEIEKQCWVSSQSEPYALFSSTKFAELIVKECMSNLYLHGYDDARAQIKQHFGVEE